MPESIAIIPDYYLYAAVARRYLTRAVQDVVCRYRMHDTNMSRLTAIAMHREALQLVDRWSDALDPRTVALCRKRHFTAIALEEMRTPSTAFRGFFRLLTQGSIASQVKRPLLFAFHIMRRKLLSPHWKTPGVQDVPKQSIGAHAHSTTRDN